jgi:cytochrome c556
MARKLVACVVAVIVMGVLVGAAVAQFAKPEDAIRYRQSVMFLIGQHVTRMAAVVKGEAPYDKAAFEKNAIEVDTLYQMPIIEAFTFPGSDKGSSRMKSEALSEKDKLSQLHSTTQAELTKLVTTAKTGDLNAIKAQFGTATGSCVACHKAFQK